LALARRLTVSIGIRGGPALRLGFGLGRARDSGRIAQRLVVVGFYHHVRNPMYVGFAAGWIGLWIVFGTRTRRQLPPSQQLLSACICS